MVELLSKRKVSRERKEVERAKAGVKREAAIPSLEDELEACFSGSNCNRCSKTHGHEVACSPDYHELP